MYKTVFFHIQCALMFNLEIFWSQKKKNYLNVKLSLYLHMNYKKCSKAFEKWHDILKNIRKFSYSSLIHASKKNKQRKVGDLGYDDIILTSSFPGHLNDALGLASNFPHVEGTNPHGHLDRRHFSKFSPRGLDVHLSIAAILVPLFLKQ